MVDPSTSRRIRGNSSIYRHRMLYSTRREGEAGLPRSFCFFKKSSEQVFLDIFAERLQRQDLLPLVADQLKSYCKGMIARFCEYDMHSASTIFLNRNASQPERLLPRSKKARRSDMPSDRTSIQDPNSHTTAAITASSADGDEEETGDGDTEVGVNEQLSMETNKKKKSRRGCRAGNLVQIRKRQRLARAFDFQESAPEPTTLAAGGGLAGLARESTLSTLSVGDRLIQTWLHKLPTPSPPLISQEGKENLDLSGSTLGSNATSRRQRKRMNRKLRALLSSSLPSRQPSQDNISSEPDTTSLALPPAISEGLRLHTSRPHPTYVSATLLPCSHSSPYVACAPVFKCGRGNRTTQNDLRLLPSPLLLLLLLPFHPPQTPLRQKFGKGLVMSTVSAHSSSLSADMSSPSKPPGDLVTISTSFYAPFAFI